MKIHPMFLIACTGIFRSCQGVRKRRRSMDFFVMEDSVHVHQRPHDIAGFPRMAIIDMRIRVSHDVCGNETVCTIVFHVGVRESHRRSSVLIVAWCLR